MLDNIYPGNSDYGVDYHGDRSMAIGEDAT